MRAEFSPNGKWLVSGRGDLCRVWAVDGWRQHLVAGKADSFAFSPDSSLLALDTGRAVIRLINLGNRSRISFTWKIPIRIAETFFFWRRRQTVTNNDEPSVHIWDLRAIRGHLAQMGLDWNLPAYPPAPPKAGSPTHQCRPLGRK